MKNLLQNIMKHTFSTKVYSNCFEFQSNNWIITLNLVPAELAYKSSDAIRPAFNYTSIWMTFVDKQSRFKKGRQHFSSSFKVNDVLRLANWNFDLQKFSMVKNNQYQEEVVSIQKISLQQNYRFTYFNNKVQNQKHKQFVLNAQEFILFQQTLKSAYLGLNFSQQRYCAQTQKLFTKIKNNSVQIRQINNKKNSSKVA